MIYKEIAPYYDLLMKNIDYERWTSYLLHIAKVYSIQLTYVCDLGAGTGNSSIPIVNNFNNFVFLDKSFYMLREAIKKKPDGLMIVGDFRNLPLKREFTLVYSLFDSLNYLINEEELRNCFKEVWRILLPDGFFIFDMNTVKGIKVIALEGEKTEEIDGIYSIWRYKLQDDIITLYLTLFVKQKNNYKRIDEIHQERGYEPEMVNELLESAGFQVIANYNCFKMEKANKNSKRIMYVVKKKNF